MLHFFIPSSLTCEVALKSYFAIKRCPHRRIAKAQTLFAGKEKKLMRLFRALQLLILLLGSFFTNCTADTASLKESANYPYNPHVPVAIWNQVSPYFLPDAHPIRAQLDRIFVTSRAIFNQQTLKEAGFKHTTPRKGSYSSIVVAKHPKLKGYLLKIFTDDFHCEEWSNFIARAHGAKIIQEAIDNFNYGHIFKVPQKWIYPLPCHPSPPNGPEIYRKNFVLVVEDMKILNIEDNALAWQTKTTKKKLDAIYTIIQAMGLYDSVYRTNLPFSSDGKLAFIDTEHYLKWPIKFSRIIESLPPTKKVYFNLLMQLGAVPSN